VIPDASGISFILLCTVIPAQAGISLEQNTVIPAQAGISLEQNTVIPAQAGISLEPAKSVQKHCFS
jgi:hypothetical protein